MDHEETSPTYWYDVTLYHIEPVAKPRMTRQDKWPNPPRNYRGKKWPRPAVAKYFAFCKEVKFMCRIELPLEGAKIVFGISMPGSWSKAKRERMKGRPHQQRPDLSNLIKALEDACWADDSGIWNYGGLSKVWAKEGYISVAKRSPFQRNDHGRNNEMVLE